MRWGEGGPKDTSGSKFPKLYIPDYRVSPGTQKSRAKSPSQESGRESGTQRRASSTGRGSGATPESPALILPRPSQISSSRSPQRTRPEPRAPRVAAPKDPSAPPAAGAGWRSLARSLTCPGTAGIGLAAARRPSLAPAIPAPIVRTCLWSLAGLGVGVGPGWEPARAAI